MSPGGGSIPTGEQTSTAKPLASLPTMIKVSRPFLTSYQINHLRKASTLTKPAVTTDNIKAFQLIWPLCRAVKFPIRTITTSMLVYQKASLYNGHKFPFVELVVACVLVASKIEDTLKRTRELVMFAHKIKNNVNLSSTQAEEAKVAVLGLERQILETIGFDFRIRHPHNYIVRICKQFDVDEKIGQLAWTIATDVYITESVLQYPSHEIAVASLWLAAKLRGHPEPSYLNEISLCCEQDHVFAIIADLLDFYIHYASQSLAGKEFPEVSTYMTIRMNMSDLLNQNGQTEDEDETTIGMGIRDPRTSDAGTVRYILEWERSHVKGEIIS